MKSKEAFIDAYANELAGQILAVFTQSERSDLATKGRFVLHELEKVKPLLEKMHDFIAEKNQVLPAPLSIDDDTEALIRRYGKSGTDDQKRVVERLRAAFTPNKNGTTEHKEVKT